MGLFDKERDTKDSGEGIVAGLATAESRGYLGSYETVTGILKELSGGTLIQFGQSEGDEAVQAVIDNLQGDCESAADIFLGGMPEDNPPVATFNTPGGIDAFLKRELPSIEESDPLRVVAAALGLYLREVLDFIKTLPDDAKQEQWQPDLDAITTRWTNLFLGIPQEA